MISVQAGFEEGLGGVQETFGSMGGSLPKVFDNRSVNSTFVDNVREVNRGEGRDGRLAPKVAFKMR